MKWVLHFRLPNAHFPLSVVTTLSLPLRLPLHRLIDPKRMKPVWEEKRENEGGGEDRWVGERTRQQQRMSEERDRQTESQVDQ